MKTIEKAEAFDLLDRWIQGRGIDEEADPAGLRILMNACAEAVQRGSADGILTQYRGCTEYDSWMNIRDLLDEYGIKEGVASFVRDAVQFALDVLDLPEVEYGAD